MASQSNPSRALPGARTANRGRISKPTINDAMVQVAASGKQSEMLKRAAIMQELAEVLQIELGEEFVEIVRLTRQRRNAAYAEKWVGSKA